MASKNHFFIYFEAFLPVAAFFLSSGNVFLTRILYAGQWKPIFWLVETILFQFLAKAFSLQCKINFQQTFHLFLSLIFCLHFLHFHCCLKKMKECGFSQSENPSPLPRISFPQQEYFSRTEFCLISITVSTSRKKALKFVSIRRNKVTF